MLPAATSQIGFLGSAVQSELTTHSTHGPEAQTVVPPCVAHSFGVAMHPRQTWFAPQIGFFVSLQSASFRQSTQIPASTSHTELPPS
jgi:hypothetical protein